MAGKFYMTDFEIARDFRLAKDREMMVEVLAGLSAVSQRVMRRKLTSMGLLPAVRRGQACHSRWVPEEDRILERGVEEGRTFAALAARLPGRSVKSVRNRWQRLQACAPRKGGLLS